MPVTLSIYIAQQFVLAVLSMLAALAGIVSLFGWRNRVEAGRIGP